MVEMVKRRPLRRFSYSVRTWYRFNRLPILLLLGAAILGAAASFYMSAFYGYKPAYYEPKEDSREIQLKQRELQEMMQKKNEHDRQATGSDR